VSVYVLSDRIIVLRMGEEIEELNCVGMAFNYLLLFYLFLFQEFVSVL